MYKYGNDMQALAESNKNQLNQISSSPVQVGIMFLLCTNKAYTQKFDTLANENLRVQYSSLIRPLWRIEYSFYSCTYITVQKL